MSLGRRAQAQVSAHSPPGARIGVTVGTTHAWGSFAAGSRPAGREDTLETTVEDAHSWHPSRAGAERQTWREADKRPDSGLLGPRQLAPRRPLWPCVPRMSLPGGPGCRIQPWPTRRRAGLAAPGCPQAAPVAPCRRDGPTCGSLLAFPPPGLMQRPHGGRMPPRWQLRHRPCAPRHRDSKTPRRREVTLVLKCDVPGAQSVRPVTQVQMGPSHLVSPQNTPTHQIRSSFVASFVSACGEAGASRHGRRRSQRTAPIKGACASAESCARGGALLSDPPTTCADPGDDGAKSSEPSSFPPSSAPRTTSSHPSPARSRLATDMNLSLAPPDRGPRPSPFPLAHIESGNLRSCICRQGTTRRPL